MADKKLTDAKEEYKTEAQPPTEQPAPELVDPWATYDAAQQIRARTFACPVDRSTRLHKAEFGSIVDGAFVIDQTTYRCVQCHTEYEIGADGQVRKAGQ